MEPLAETRKVEEGRVLGEGRPLQPKGAQPSSAA